MGIKWFLFVSADAALITDLARQVHPEGHDVRYHIEAESDRDIGDGIWIGSDVNPHAAEASQ